MSRAPPPPTVRRLHLCYPATRGLSCKNSGAKSAPSAAKSAAEGHPSPSAWTPNPSTPVGCCLEPPRSSRFAAQPTRHRELERLQTWQRMGHEKTAPFSQMPTSRHCATPWAGGCACRDRRNSPACAGHVPDTPAARCPSFARRSSTDRSGRASYALRPIRWPRAG